MMVVVFLLMLSKCPFGYNSGEVCSDSDDSWADGWRGFIDGAFEIGRASAWRILKEARDRQRTSKL